MRLLTSKLSFVNHATRITWKCWAILLLSVLALVALVGLAARYVPPAYTFVLDRRIAWALPNGATNNQVEAWLQSEGLHYYATKGTWADRIGNQTVTQRAKLRDAQVAQCTKAPVRTPGPLDDFYQVTLYFFFDERNRLIKHSVELCPTGF